MSAYEELVERCYVTSEHAVFADIRAILAEVLRTLEAVTPEQSEAGESAFENGYVHEVYTAMLRASALNPPVKS